MDSQVDCLPVVQSEQGPMQVRPWGLGYSLGSMARAVAQHEPCLAAYRWHRLQLPQTLTARLQSITGQSGLTGPRHRDK